MKVYPFGTVELKEKGSDSTLKVNEHRVKEYHEGVSERKTLECLCINDFL